MKNKPMCNSLLRTGAVLLVFLLLVHLTLSRPDGSIFGSIGILIVSLFKLVFFVIGLAIGIAICLAVFLGIFVAAAYLVRGRLGRETAEKTWATVQRQSRSALAALAPGRFGHLAPAAACCGEAAHPEACACTASMTSTASTASTTEIAAPPQISGAPPAAQDQTLKMLQLFEERVENIEASVRAVETSAAHFVHGEELDALRGTVQELGTRSQTELAEAFAPVQGQLEEMTRQGELLSAAGKKLDDIVQRLTALEERMAQFTDLPQQVTDLRGALQQQAEALQQKTQAPAKSRSSRKKTT